MDGDLDIPEDVKQAQYVIFEWLRAKAMKDNAPDWHLSWLNAGGTGWDMKVKVMKSDDKREAQ